MQITDGSMSYELSLDYNKALKGAQQMLAALGDINASMKAFGDLGDEWTQQTKESVNAQKQYIKSLEKEYDELAKKKNLTTKESDRKKSLSTEIDAEKKSLEDMEAALNALALAEKDPRRQLMMLKRELQNLKEAGLQNTEEFQKLSERAKNLGTELRKFDRNFRQSIDPMRTFQVASSLSKVARSIQEIAKASGDANLEKTGQFVNAVADGVQGFVQGGYIGLIIAGVGETITRITELITATEKLGRAMDSIELKAFANEISDLLTTKPMDNIFGADAVEKAEKAVDAFNKAKEAIDKIEISVDATALSFTKMLGVAFNSPKTIFDYFDKGLWNTENQMRYFNAEYDTFKKGIEDGLTSLEAMPIRIKDNNWFGEALIGIDDEFMNLRTLIDKTGLEWDEKLNAPTLKSIEAIKASFTGMTESEKQDLEEITVKIKAYEDSLKSLSEYLQNIFGQAASQLADNLVESFVAGGNAMSKFENVAANVGKTLAKQTIQHLIIDKVMNKYKEKIDEIVNGEGKWEEKNVELAATFLAMKGDLEALQPTIDAVLKQFKDTGAFDGDSGLASRLEEEAQAIAKANNMRIEAMKDGHDKEMAQIKESRKQEREALKREIASSNGMKSGGTIKALQDQIKLSKQLEEKELKELEEKWSAEIIKANKEFAELQLKEAEKRIDRETEIQQAIIDEMDNGLGKELAQMELNHQKKIETIRRNAESEAKEVAEANAKAWMREQLEKGNKVELADYYQSDVFKSMVNGLTPEQQAELDKKMQERIKEQQQKSAKQIDDAYDKSLQKYGSYTAKKEAIYKKYNADIIALEKRRKKLQQDGLQGSKEYQQTEEAIAQAEKDRADAVTDLNLQYTELSQLIAERERLEKRLQLVKEGGEDVDGLSEEQLQKALKETKKKIKSLSQETFSEYLDEHKSELISQGLDMITDSLYGLAEATGSLNAKQAADFFSSLKLGVQGFMSGGVWGLLIAGIEDTISQITNAFIGAEALASQVEHGKVAAWQQEMANLREQGKEGIFGEDQIANVRSAVLALDESRVKLHELSEEWQQFDYDFNHFLEGTNPLSWHNWAEIFTDAEENVKTYFEALEKGYSKLEAHVLTKQDRGWLLNFFGIDDRYGNLKDMAKDIGFDELYDKYGNLDSNVLRTILETYTDLSEADKRWIEEAIAYSDEYAAALEQIADYLENLFGNVADTIADQMLDAFIKSGDAAIDFGAVVSDVGKQMAKDLLKSMIMDTYFNGLKEKFTEKIKDEGGMTADAAGYIMQTMNQAVDNLNGDIAYWNQVLTNLSTLWGDAEAASIGAGNALSSSSQESIDLMNGQLNAMRAYQGRMESMMNAVLLQLSGIHNDMNAHFEESNRHLNAIDSNTSKEGLVRSLGAYFG